MTALRCNTHSALAQELGVTNSAIFYAANEDRVSPRWLLRVLYCWQISPEYILYRQAPEILTFGYIFVYPPCNWSPAIEAQVNRLKFLFGGQLTQAEIAALANVRRYLIQKTHGRFSSTFLLEMFLKFGINPAWIVSATDPVLFNSKLFLTHPDMLEKFIPITGSAWEKNPLETPVWYAPQPELLPSKPGSITAPKNKKLSEREIPCA